MQDCVEDPKVFGMKKNIVLFGAGSHAHVVIDIIEKQDIYNIIGLIDSKKNPGEIFDDYRIIGKQENLVSLIEEYSIDGGIVCIGDNYWRGFVAEFILNLVSEFKFFNAIHPDCVIGKGVKIGQGNVFMPGVIINPYASIGNHCIINTNSSLEHFCVMEDYSSLSAGVITGGYAKIGTYTAIALGVTLFDRIKVGKHTVIGSGALVTKDVEDYVLSYGVPAKTIKSRRPGDKYLK